jgi:glycosyltransferase involved in cell wall biosynthesis
LRVFFISYQFPPVGGAGVQRPAKFVKYLHEFGWKVVVLTVKNPSVPVYDESLDVEVPPAVEIIRARTFEPAYHWKSRLTLGVNKHKVGKISAFLKKILKSMADWIQQPDAQVLWMPAAVWAGINRLRKKDCDVIAVTAPPYSSFLLGILLGKMFRIPVVLDFRDEWDISSSYLENMSRARLALKVQAKQQLWVLRNAESLIATTRLSAKRLEQKAKLAGNQKSVYHIYNGYDPDDFSYTFLNQNSRSPRRMFKLFYVGTLWNLTSAQPLVNAVLSLEESGWNRLDQLELGFLGRKTPEQKELINKICQTKSVLTDIDYLSHREALQYMQNADGLCVILSPLPGAERVVPAKIFEYMVCQKYVLAIAPVGELSEIVNNYSGHSHFLPSDIDGIKAWLIHKLEGNGVAAHNYTKKNDYYQQFSRKNQAKKFDDILRECIKKVHFH